MKRLIDMSEAELHAYFNAHARYHNRAPKLKYSIRPGVGRALFASEPGELFRDFVAFVERMKCDDRKK